MLTQETAAPVAPETAASTEPSRESSRTSYHTLTSELVQATRWIAQLEQSRDAAWKLASEHLHEATRLRLELDAAIDAQIDADLQAGAMLACVKSDVETAVGSELECWLENHGGYAWGVPADCRVSVCVGEDREHVPDVIEGVANGTDDGDERGDVEFIATLQRIERARSGWDATYTVEETN